jgi:putative hydrolase
MTIAFDSHTHTLASGHAFSTIEEYVASCRQNGLEGFATTDHGPAMTGAAQVIYFYNLVSLPREIGGIRILRGAETNIVGYDGRLDLPDFILHNLDVCIASLHDLCLRPQSKDDHTAAWLNILQNPDVDILGHSGRGPYPYDLDRVLQACREQDKAVEINNLTLTMEQSIGTCREIALACSSYGVKIVVSSDAHVSCQVGQVENALALLASIDFPMELVVNKTYAEFSNWLKGRKPWLSGL